MKKLTLRESSVYHMTPKNDSQCKCYSCKTSILMVPILICWPQKISRSVFYYFFLVFVIMLVVKRVAAIWNIFLCKTCSVQTALTFWILQGIQWYRNKFAQNGSRYFLKIRFHNLRKIDFFICFRILKISKTLFIRFDIFNKLWKRIFITDKKQFWTHRCFHFWIPTKIQKVREI